MHEMDDLATLIQHSGEEEPFPYGAVSPPIVQTSLFTARTLRERHTSAGGEGVYYYSRVSNPTVDLAERKIAMLEGAERALLFASGMAAISSTLLTFLRAGDHVICVENAYPPTRVLLGEWLPRFGVEVTFVPGTEVQQFAAVQQPHTRLLYLESPTSLTFQLQDLQAVAEWARAQGILTLCDNSWATPIFQNPLALGVDLVLHSASKYLGGHSDLLAGVVAGKAELIQSIAHTRELLGGVLEAFGAWLLIRGLRTLPVRMERLQQSGLQVARWLAEQPFVAQINHPGLPSHPQHALAQRQMRGYGSLFSLHTLPITDEQAYTFTDHLRLFRFGPSWGGHESLMIGWGEGEPDTAGRRTWFFRLYIGLEHPDDLIRDLSHAAHQAGLATHG
ncbi:MAG: PLP-dependent aspartate aminotransferase family protein [Fimbriimonadales bacterium]|nr:PLP-dependent aspartate aminotransferase family protein [Fimbriimonadales bacterium]